MLSFLSMPVVKETTYGISLNFHMLSYQEDSNRQVTILAFPLERVQLNARRVHIEGEPAMYGIILKDQS